MVSCCLTVHCYGPAYSAAHCTWFPWKLNSKLFRAHKCGWQPGESYGMLGSSARTQHHLAPAHKFWWIQLSRSKEDIVLAPELTLPCLGNLIIQASQRIIFSPSQVTFLSVSYVQAIHLSLTFSSSFVLFGPGTWFKCICCFSWSRPPCLSWASTQDCISEFSPEVYFPLLSAWAC